MPEKPAFTPEEWSWLGSGAHLEVTGGGRFFMGIVEVDPARERHRAAAMALWGQPFGFTREDVAILNSVLWAWHKGPLPLEHHFPGMSVLLGALRDRVEALLPPNPAATKGLPPEAGGS